MPKTIEEHMKVVELERSTASARGFFESASEGGEVVGYDRQI